MPNRDSRSNWTRTARYGPRRRNLSALMAVGLLFSAMPPFLEIFTSNEHPDGIISEVSAMTLLSILAAVQSPFARAIWLGDRHRSVYPAIDRDHFATATRRAALTILAMAAVVFLWLWLASIMGWPAPTSPKQWFALGWSFLTIAATLPILIAERIIQPPFETESG